MASTAQLLVPLPFGLLATLFAVTIVLLEIFVDYKTYARILKWLAIALLAYPVTAFIVGQSWLDVVRSTFAFNLSVLMDPTTMYIVVGILGTTISPYLFFWDTSEVVENELATHRLASSGSLPHVTKHFLRSIRIDNFTGMTLASVTAWFIVITCASVLFSHGVTNIDSAADAARALEPLVVGFPDAGLIAKLIFSFGVIGIGLLAVPVLAGSSSYAISEAFGWKEGLHRSFKRAHGFYGVIILATLVGLGINFLGINPIQALIFTAVFNGIAAVPLLWMLASIGTNRNILGEYTNGPISNFFVRLTLVLMAAAVIALGWSFLPHA
jgi:Mn2+/Fe2+ NRAMP family transporter